MDESERESSSSVFNNIAGCIILAGIMGILVSPAFGAVLAVASLPDGWNWMWFIVAWLALTATFAAICLLLMFIPYAIWLCQLGHWPKESDAPKF